MSLRPGASFLSKLGACFLRNVACGVPYLLERVVMCPCRLVEIRVALEET